MTDELAAPRRYSKNNVVLETSLQTNMNSTLLSWWVFVRQLIQQIHRIRQSMFLFEDKDMLKAKSYCANVADNVCVALLVSHSLSLPTYDNTDHSDSCK